MIIESFKQSKVGHVQTPTQHLLQEVPGLQGTQSEPQAEHGGQNDPGLPDDHRKPQAEQDGHVQSPTPGRLVLRSVIFNKSLIFYKICIFYSINNLVIISFENFKPPQRIS